MPINLIELNDGLLVEVEADEEAVPRISAGSAVRVDRALSGAQSLLKKAVQEAGPHHREAGDSTGLGVRGGRQSLHRPRYCNGEYQLHSGGVATERSFVREREHGAGMAGCGVSDRQ